MHNARRKSLLSKINMTTDEYIEAFETYPFKI